MIKKIIDGWTAIAKKIIQGEQEPEILLLLIILAIALVLVPPLITGNW